jgi:hypothetical protein
MLKIGLSSNNNLKRGVGMNVLKLTHEYRRSLKLMFTNTLSVKGLFSAVSHETQYAFMNDKLAVKARVSANL